VNRLLWWGKRGSKSTN